MGSRQDTRRSRPNRLKLSGFVDLFALIILVINLLGLTVFSHRYRSNIIYAILCTRAFSCKKTEAVAYQKNDDNSLLDARILKPIKDSDSS